MARFLFDGLHELPATEVVAGDLLLDADYYPIGTVTAANKGALTVEVLSEAQGRLSLPGHHTFSFDGSDYLAIVRNAEVRQ